MIKVSVIIPVYNVAPYLQQCLSSIVEQSLNEIEIICIDDASIDGSTEILKEASKKDLRIIPIFNKKNFGAAYCRNVGLKMAKGEYIAILDSDDYFDLRMLELGYEKGKLNNADLVYWGAYIYNEQTGKIEDTLQNHFLEETVKKLAKKTVALTDDEIVTYGLCQPAPWYKLHRRLFIEDNKLRFQNLSNSNDVYFGKMAPFLAERICFIDEPLVYHRRGRVGQISATRGKNPECAYQALKAIKMRMDEEGIFEKFHRNFVHYVMVSIRYAAIMSAQINGDWEAFQLFMKREGWASLGMLECNAKDFLRPMGYAKWVLMVRDNLWKKAFDLDIDDFFDEYLIREIKKLNCRFCLWGYGKRGKKFFSAAKKYRLAIDGIIDENKDLMGEIDGCYIAPLTKHSSKYDVAIITNTLFFDNIKKKIKNSNHHNMKILDVQISISYGVPIRQCLFE